MLEFLTEYEVEVTAATCTVDAVETVSPVNTHHTYHGGGIYADRHRLNA